MSQSNQTVKRLFLKLLVFGIGFSLLHIVLERCMAFAASDVTLSAWVRVLNVAIILCDAAFFFVEYAILFASLKQYGIGTSLSVILLPVALALFKHIGNWWAFLITENITQAIDIRLSAVTAFSSILIELLQYGLVLAVLLCFRKSPDGARLLLVCGILLAVNLISRIIGDIEYGAPTSMGEIGVMLAYYAFDTFLYGPAAYLVMRFTVKKQNRKDPTE